MTSEQRPPTPRRAERHTRPTARGALAGFGAIVGIVTALVALGVAQLVAAILASPIGQPVTAVGELSINNAPATVKNFAIREFGSNDKTVLVWGIRGVLIIFAALIGVARDPQALAGHGRPRGLRRNRRLCRAQPAYGEGQRRPALAHRRGRGRVRAALLQRPGAATGAASATAPPAQPARAAGAAQPPAEAQGGLPPRRDPLDWRPADAAQGRARVEPAPDRRRFLLAGAAIAGVSLLTYAGGSWLANTRDVNAIQQALKLPPPTSPAPPLPPGTDLKIPGLSSFVTPNSKFYRVDTAIVVPEILPAHWRLRIHGMVRKELVLTFADLIKRPLIEDWITLCCVSNLVAGPYIGNAKWLGASLRSLLQEAGIKAGADQLFCTSSDGFTSGTPVQTAMDGRDALLAVAMNGAALPVEHGFPARLVIPGLYGYVSACKWIVDIEVTTYAANQAYWVPRGWDPQAPVKTESRIDVPTGLNPTKAGKQVSIAGVAFAQHKGIEAVEVRVAKGPWQQAKLAAVPGIDTWRQWVYDWNADVRPGNYLVEARATDKTGYTQTSRQEPPEPNGASGYPSVLLNVVA